MTDALFEFQSKIRNKALAESDFLQPGLLELFDGKYDTAFAKRIADCEDAVFERGEDKLIYRVAMDGEWEVRLDFVCEGGAYKLCALDSYTLPLKEIDRLPFNDFKPLPQKQEARMREEYRITRMVRDFVALKGMLGKAKALEWFWDGRAEKTGVSAWMPYFSGRKAFIAHCAWMQSRLYGEDVYITEFSQDKSELLFRGSMWLFLYRVSGHLKRMIEYEEYLELYEAIWKDRAACNGYRADIAYDHDDIRITFWAI